MKREHDGENENENGREREREGSRGRMSLWMQRRTGLNLGKTCT